MGEMLVEEQIKGIKHSQATNKQNIATQIFDHEWWLNVIVIALIMYFDVLELFVKWMKFVTFRNRSSSTFDYCYFHNIHNSTTKMVL